MPSPSALQYGITIQDALKLRAALRIQGAPHRRRPSRGREQGWQPSPQKPRELKVRWQPSCTKSYEQRLGGEGLRMRIVMKNLLSLAVALAIVSATTPAAAHVVEITASVALVDVRDEAELEAALKEAMDSALTEAITFKPTLLALTGARVVGQRLYVQWLIADEQGERELRDKQGQELRGEQEQRDESGASWKTKE
jgi:hypothetical protein